MYIQEINIQVALLAGLFINHELATLICVVYEISLDEYNNTR